MPPGRYGIGLYAPSGFALDPAAIDRAVVLLEARGHAVVVDPTCRARWQRFSAPDDERLAAVLRMAQDPRVELAIALRGGYGWSRLLDRLDFPMLARAGKRWLGYSDFTAFQLAALAHAGMTSFAGPVAASDFGAVAPSAYTLDHCFGLLEAREYAIDCALDGPDCEVSGTLWGGNLAMVAHLVGTPHFPRIDGGILFVEDVGEVPYRVERMFQQLHHAGVLARQRAVLLGRFTEYALSANDGGYDLDAVVGELRRLTPASVLTGLPFGHVADKLTLPVGGDCTVIVRRGQAKITLGNYAR